MDMPDVGVNGITLHYLDEGRGAPILLLHGLGSCGEDWVLQTQYFSGEFRVVAPDLRGHGQSTKPAGAYSIALLASDVACLLDALSIDSAHVVGLSLGGLVAQQLAIDFPRRVLSLALINTFARLLSGNVRELARVLRRGFVSLVLPMRTNAQLIARGLFPQPHQAEMRRLAVQRIMTNDRAAYRAAIIAIRDFDSRRSLHRVTCPTLVVTGESDSTVPRARQRELAGGIRDARWEIIRDSGHATPIDQPAAFNALLRAFLRDSRAGL